MLSQQLVADSLLASPAAQACLTERARHLKKPSKFGRPGSAEAEPG